MLQTISAVLFRDGDWWVAQCVEYDIATQAKKLDDIYYEIERVLVGHLVVANELNRKPFENIPPAPSEFFQAFQDGWCA